MNEPEAIAVTVLTGFLGSGKTTLLSCALRESALADTAVLINEFGEIGLDHLLVRPVDGATVLLASGCICCSVRDDLAETLSRLLKDRAHQKVPQFSRVLIETTGLADPGPILAMLQTDPRLSGYLQPAIVVTTVDALHGQWQLNEHLESVQQVALADVVILTKTQMAPPQSEAWLRARLQALNPQAEVLADPSASAAHAALFFTDTERVRHPICSDDQHKAPCDSACDHPEHQHDGPHDSRIQSHTMTFDEPFSWELLADWLGEIAFFHGEHVLRIKGLFAVVGESRPVAINGVRHLVHKPTLMDAWPDANRQSRLVFITLDLDKAVFEKALQRARLQLRELEPTVMTRGLTTHE